MSRQSLDLVVNAVGGSVQQNWGGGDGLFAVVLGSATSVKLQYLLPDGSSWVDAGTETSLTANGGGIASLPSGGVRALVTGTATGVYAKLTSV